jgi:hypothetical protein
MAFLSGVYSSYRLALYIPSNTEGGAIPTSLGNSTSFQARLNVLQQKKAAANKKKVKTKDAKKKKETAVATKTTTLNASPKVKRGFSALDWNFDEALLPQHAKSATTLSRFETGGQDSMPTQQNDETKNQHKVGGGSTEGTAVAGTAHRNDVSVKRGTVRALATFAEENVEKSTVELVEADLISDIAAAMDEEDPTSALEMLDLSNNELCATIPPSLG